MIPYSAFLASRANESRASRGEDISVTVDSELVPCSFEMEIYLLVVLFASISAAQRAAPTVVCQYSDNTRKFRHRLPVFVKENKIEAKGTSSSNVATVPNLKSHSQYKVNP